MGLVLVNTTISLDGFVAGPRHEMDWVFDHHFLPDAEPVPAVEGVVRTTGAILTGRGSYDVGRSSTRAETSGPFGGRWSGPEFVLTHRPPEPADPSGPRFLDLPVGEAVATARAAAGEGNVLVLGANVAQQCLRADLVDEILLFVLPILLGRGISLFSTLEGRLLFEAVHVEQVGQAVALRVRRRR